jgi:hypothetical protein
MIITVGTEVDLVWLLFFFTFSVSLICMFISIFRSVFVFIQLLFFTSGASSPEWVKPAAQGGGLLVF